MCVVDICIDIRIRNVISRRSLELVIAEQRVNVASTLTAEVHEPIAVKSAESPGIARYETGQSTDWDERKKKRSYQRRDSSEFLLFFFYFFIFCECTRRSERSYCILCDICDNDNAVMTKCQCPLFDAAKWWKITINVAQVSCLWNSYEMSEISERSFESPMSSESVAFILSHNDTKENFENNTNY